MKSDPRILRCPLPFSLDMSAAPAPVLGKHKLEGASDDGQSENKQIKR
jgi:hypothetical protein